MARPYFKYELSGAVYKWRYYDDDNPTGMNLDSGVLTSGDNTFTGDNTFNEPVTIDKADGTAPLVITSTTKVTNLNADKVDGYDSDNFVLISTSITSSATPTPARASKKTEYVITALAAAAEFGEPTGTPELGDLLLISVTDDGEGRAITWNAIYDDPYSSTLPTTTTANKTIIMLFRYNSATLKWELLFVDEES